MSLPCRNPQFGDLIRVSFPAALVTSDEKTPATANSDRLHRASKMIGRFLCMYLGQLWFFGSLQLLVNMLDHIVECVE